PVAGSRVAGKCSGSKTELNSGGGCSPSGTKTARITKMFGPGEGRPDEEGNGTLLNSSSVLIPPAQFRANRFQLSPSASRAAVSSGGARSSTDFVSRGR